MKLQFEFGFWNLVLTPSVCLLLSHTHRYTHTHTHTHTQTYSHTLTQSEKPLVPQLYMGFQLHRKT